MKMTLVEIVQNILSSMDSDDVNFIDDTEESIQVATVVQETYYHIISQKDWKHTERVVELESVSDADRPNLLRMPDNILEMWNLRYEKVGDESNARAFAKVQYEKPNDFLDRVYTRELDGDNIIEVTLDGIPYFIYNDRHPTFWTSFDDEFIMFDSYNAIVESTVQGNKSIIQCYVNPTWLVEDTFIPQMAEKHFPLLLEESKRACHLYFKQQDSPVDARRALRSWNTLRGKDERSHSRKDRPRFGRRQRHGRGNNGSR